MRANNGRGIRGTDPWRRKPTGSERVESGAGTLQGLNVGEKAWRDSVKGQYYVEVSTANRQNNRPVARAVGTSQDVAWHRSTFDPRPLREQEANNTCLWHLQWRTTIPQQPSGRCGSAILPASAGKFATPIRDAMYLYFDPATASPDNISCQLLPA